MSKCDLAVHVDRPDRLYRPGETVRGEVSVRVNAPCSCTALTAELQWRTHGRGNKASGSAGSRLVFRGEWSPGEEHRFPFEFSLPPGPVTYHGKVLNVDWYVAARADIPWAIDPKAEADLLLAPGGAEAPYSFGPSYVAPAQLFAQSGKGRGCAVLFLSVFGLAGLAATIMTCLAMAGSIRSSGAVWVGFLVGGIFMLIGFGGILGILWSGIAQRKLGTPEVRIGSSVVRTGERIPVRLNLRPRKEVALTGVSAVLRGWEEVVSGSGTRRTTHRHTVHESTVELSAGPRSIQAGESVEFEGALQVPPEGPATFAAPDNALKWAVTLRVGIASWPDWSQEYPVSVRPGAG